MQRMMKEAQKMAAEMQKAQAELAEVEVEGTAGGGAVKVVATGDLQIVSITIDPATFDGEPDADDVEMLGDTVTAAVNSALGQGARSTSRSDGSARRRYGRPRLAGHVAERTACSPAPSRT